MKSLFLRCVAAAVLGAPAAAHAQEPAGNASPHKITGNLALVSDYRFRGLSQTFGEGYHLGPAVQGGIDYAHESGVYLGNWNSNVSGNQFPDGSSVEMDFYGGYKQSAGELGLDVGTIYYHYPGAKLAGLATAGGGVTSKSLDTWELYVGGSWKFLSLRYSYSLGDYFGFSEDAVAALDSPRNSTGPLPRNGGTRGTQYAAASLAYPLSPKLTLLGGLGYTVVRHYSRLDYLDYRLGLAYDLNGWALGAALVGSNARENYWFAASPSGTIRRVGQPTLVFSVGRAF